MNPYLPLRRLEFTVTHACTGRCRHCSVADRRGNGGSLDPDAAERAVRELAGEYTLESVMTFGGEPLLYPDTVARIHGAARDCGIPKRQLITNGYFTKDGDRADGVAELLCRAGVNNILLSVDAFHQEYIPEGPVLEFARALLRRGAPKLRAHPAWLGGEERDNPENETTRRILRRFADEGIAASRGNVIFPAGDAARYLAEYFPREGPPDLSVRCGEAPYTSPPDRGGCLAVEPDGRVILCSFSIGELGREDILEIVRRYDPYADPVLRVLTREGVAGLARYARERGIEEDLSDCRTACGVCRRLMAALGRS